MKVLVVTGSSGGHIYPALSFVEALKEKDKEADILLVLPKRASMKDKLSGHGYTIKFISIEKINLRLGIVALRAIFNFLKGTLESLFIILGFRPDAVVGFGSLSTIPTVIFAWFFRIRVVVHEQNAIPGLANQLLARFADRIAISFPETKEFWKGLDKKLIFTGNPIRSSLAKLDKREALNFFQLSAPRLTILVMGGSQGSHSINMQFLKFMQNSQSASKLQIIHLSGEKDFVLLEEGYKKVSAKVRLFAYLDKMQYAYSACDFIVSRAGALSVTEISYFRIPALFVPYPYAYRHQSANAGFLSKEGSCIVIKDEELNPDSLSSVLEPIINNPQELERMRLAYKRIILPQAGQLLVNAVGPDLGYS